MPQDQKITKLLREINIKLENNQVANPHDTISKIARVFGKSVDELLDFCLT